MSHTSTDTKFCWYNALLSLPTGNSPFPTEGNLLTTFRTTRRENLSSLLFNKDIDEHNPGRIALPDRAGFNYLELSRPLWPGLWLDDGEQEVHHSTTRCLALLCYSQSCSRPLLLPILSCIVSMMRRTCKQRGTSPIPASQLCKPQFQNPMGTRFVKDWQKFYCNL